jgi:hypothetical protein
VRAWLKVMVVTGAAAWSACGSSPAGTGARGGSGGVGEPGGRQLAFPIVESYDGALLAPLDLITIVSQTQSTDAEFLFGFSSGIGASAWWKRLAEEYDLGSASAVANLMGPPITADMTDHDVYDYITSAISANGGPERNGNSLYLLYLPPGITVIEQGVPNTGCDKFEAYHAAYGTRGDNLAVVQQCGGTDPRDSMTVAASHEIIEAATDPDYQSYVLPAIAPHAPWTEPIWNAYNLTGRAELADLCVGTYDLEAGYYYQRIWSNLDVAKGGDPCAPELAEPYYVALFAQDWYPINAGQTLTIPIFGWASSGMSSAWPLDAYAASAKTGFTATVGGNGTLKANETSSVLVTAPADAPSGTFAVVSVESDRPMTTPPLTDGAHINYVGVYVP